MGNSAGPGAGGIGRFAFAASTIKRATVVPGTNKLCGAAVGVGALGIVEKTTGGTVGSVGNTNPGLVVPIVARVLDVVTVAAGVVVVATVPELVVVTDGITVVVVNSGIVVVAPGIVVVVVVVTLAGIEVDVGVDVVVELLVVVVLVVVVLAVTTLARFTNVTEQAGH